VKKATQKLWLEKILSLYSIKKPSGSHPKAFSAVTFGSPTVMAFTL